MSSSSAMRLTGRSADRSPRGTRDRDPGHPHRAGDPDALAMSQLLHARHDGVENVLEIDGTQQQLIDLRESLEHAELLIEARRRTIEIIDEEPRLIR
jgi:hypothetical protein